MSCLINGYNDPLNWVPSEINWLLGGLGVSVIAKSVPAVARSLNQVGRINPTLLQLGGIFAGAVIGGGLHELNKAVPIFTSCLSDVAKVSGLALRLIGIGSLAARAINNYVVPAINNYVVPGIAIF
ncbi:MAG: hypothetical protein K1X28_03340 [Parachlamydiales bacterium]|nr:hypothetical protein [Parachlamydiales bacterium]